MRYLAVIVVLHAGIASAVPVTYTLTATGYGSLGGVEFNATDFVLTAVADTDDVVSVSFGFIVPSSDMDVFVSGIGGGEFTNSVQVFSNQTFAGAGFGDNDVSRAILAVSSSIFSTYDLTTSIGPISGIKEFNAGVSFPTTAGAFILDDLSFSPLFTAVVPEPTTLALLCLVIGSFRRMRCAT